MAVLCYGHTGAVVAAAIAILRWVSCNPKPVGFAAISAKKALTTILVYEEAAQARKVAKLYLHCRPTV